jgi:tripartite-type tricarboxylate transporter receptor subunit TctC
MLASSQVLAQPSVGEFYKGKTIHLIIGAAVGAGYDAYSRLIARHLGKHIPGNPDIVPQNLDGAGAFRAAQRVAVTAPQDGTYVGANHPTTLLDPIMGNPKRKVARLDYAYLGSASKNLSACFFRADAPVKTFAETFDREIVIGVGTEASTTREYSAVLKNLLGAKLKMAGGYSGNGQIYLAIDRGEVQGTCGMGYTGAASLRPNWFRDGTVNVVAQESVAGDAALNAKGIPRTAQFAKTDEQRQILDIYYSQQEFGRPYVVGAKVPRERVEALQRAFMTTLADPELLQEAKKLNFDISPLPAADLEALVKKAYAAPAPILAKLRQALGYGH